MQGKGRYVRGVAIFCWLRACAHSCLAWGQGVAQGEIRADTLVGSGLAHDLGDSSLGEEVEDVSPLDLEEFAYERRHCHGLLLKKCCLMTD